jgi:hypothetical protein
VPISVLIADFGYSYGDSIYARVKTRNVVGETDYSAVGNGAVILTLPDAPLNLVSEEEFTTKTQIKISWQEGASNGGTPIDLYRVWVSTDLGANFNVLATSVTQSFYLATGLVTGTVYQFKVQAHN